MVFLFQGSQRKQKKKSPYPYDFSKKDIFVLKRIHDFTMTSLTNRKVLLNSVRYLVKEKIKGCLVECGVWRGGSSMAMAYWAWPQRSVT